MAEKLTLKEVINGQKLCEEGMPFDYVYFVLKGEFRVTRKIRIEGANE
jgi:CRP-like cAMP-binding protein